MVTVDARQNGVKRFLKEFLSDPKFLQRLFNFDKDGITDEIVE